MTQNRIISIYCYGCKKTFEKKINGENLHQYETMGNAFIKIDGKGENIKCDCGSDHLYLKDVLKLEKSDYPKKKL